MSDGITDAYRDEKRANLEEEISKVELNLVLAGRGCLCGRALSAGIQKHIKQLIKELT